jgi:hypothetical protein
MLQKTEERRTTWDNRQVENNTTMTLRAAGDDNSW